MKLLDWFFDQEPAVLFHADLVTGVAFEPGYARVVFALGAHAFEFIRRCAGFGPGGLDLRCRAPAYDSEDNQSTGR